MMPAGNGPPPCKAIRERPPIRGSEDLMEPKEGPLLSPPEDSIHSEKALVNYVERRRVRGELGAFFQVVATVSTFSSRDDLLRELQRSRFEVVGEFGDLIELEAKAKDKETGETKKIPFQMFYDSREGFHLFMTRATKTDDMPDTLFSFMNRTRNVSNLWIPPSLMHELKGTLHRQFGNDFQLSYFTAIRNAHTKIDADVRPHVDRTFQYTGLDAKSTLDELESTYGVYPKILEVRLRPDSRFRIDDKGIITLRDGCSMDHVFTVLDTLKNSARVIADAVRSSQTERRRIGGIERWIQYPWAISMPTGVRAGLQEHFITEIRNDPWALATVIPCVEEEIPYLSGRFVDCKKDSSFDLELTKNRARVYPVDRMDVGTALRLFQFVSLNEDIQATVGASE